MLKAKESDNHKMRNQGQRSRACSKQDGQCLGKRRKDRMVRSQAKVSTQESIRTSSDEGLAVLEALLRH